MKVYIFDSNESSLSLLFCLSFTLSSLIDVFFIMSVISVYIYYISNK